MKRRLFIASSVSVSVAGCISARTKPNETRTQSTTNQSSDNEEPEVFEETENSTSVENSLTFGDWYTDELNGVGIQINGYRVEDYLFGKDSGMTIDGNISARKIPEGKWLVVEQKIKKLSEDGFLVSELTAQVGNSFYTDRGEYFGYSLPSSPGQYYDNESDTWQDELRVRGLDYDLPIGGGVEYDEKGTIEQVWEAIDIPSDQTIQSPTVGYGYSEDSGWSVAWSGD